MDAISRVWYKVSYTIAAKPIKTLELHYTMILFLINEMIIANTEPGYSPCLISNARSRNMF